MTPRPKSSNRSDRLNALISRENSLPKTASALAANANGALKSAPRMNPTVKLFVRNEATIPIAIIANPISQYPR